MPSSDSAADRRSIAVIAPIRPGATSGNSVTARRWATQFVELGHHVEVMPFVEGSSVDVLAPDADFVVVLHARRCAGAAVAAKTEGPQRPLIVALAGTDLYKDLPDNIEASEALDLADALVVLQPDGLEHLESMKRAWVEKAHVVHQSVQPKGLTHQPSSDTFTVVVLSFLRDVKDPLLAAKAARLLPSSSNVRVVHAGSAHSTEWEEQAIQEAHANPRYEWLREVDTEAASKLLASAHVLACTSVLEGGANVVSEAIAQGVAVIGTDIGGNRGLLGSDHPGLVPVGDFEALAKLINSLEQNPDQLAELTQRSKDRQWITAPRHEQAQWQAVLDTLA